MKLKLENHELKDALGEVRQKIKEGEHTITHYEFPDPFGIAGLPQVFYGRTDKFIVSYSGPVLPDTKKEDHVAQVKTLLKALSGEKMKSLADRDTYKATMSKLIDGGKYKEHQAKWFVESFGFIDAAKKAERRQEADSCRPWRCRVQADRSEASKPFSDGSRQG